MADDTNDLDLNEVQQDTMLSLYYSVLTSSTCYNVHSRGANALCISNSLSGADYTQIGLPANQWERQIMEWFSVSLARIQQQAFNYATSPPHHCEGLRLAKGRRALCARHKDRGASGYVSVSVLGLAVILVIGSLLIATALGLDPAVGALQQRLRWKDHKRRQWAADELLELQRLADEKAVQGRCNGDGSRCAMRVSEMNNLSAPGLRVDNKCPMVREDGYDPVEQGEGTFLHASHDSIHVDLETLAAEPRRALGSVQHLRG